MHKSRKVDLVNICLLIIAAATFLLTLYLEFRSSMIAVVDGGNWEIPQTVVRELRVVEDVNETIAMDPNRMTAKDALKSCSLYLINIRNKGEHKTENTQISMPRAVHWEASWETEDGEKTKNRSNTTLITLPDITCGRDIDVKVWAACKPTRSHAKKIKITQDYGHARLDIKAPVWSSALYLSQRMSKVVKICVIVLVIIFLKLIKKPIQIRYLRWRQQRSAPLKSV